MRDKESVFVHGSITFVTYERVAIPEQSIVPIKQGG